MERKFRDDFRQNGSGGGRGAGSAWLRDADAVQSAVLAPEADGADLLVSAQTGSGKTVAFGIAIAPTLLGGAERFNGPAPPAP